MKATRKEIYNAKTLEALKELGAKYGWKFGAAEKIYQARINKQNRG